MQPASRHALFALLLAAVVAAAPRSSSAPPCSFNPWTTERLSRVPGEYIVTLRRHEADRRPAVEDLAHELLEQVGGGEVGHVGEGRLFDFSARGLSRRAARRLGRHPAVAAIEPEMRAYAAVPQHLPDRCR